MKHPKRRDMSHRLFQVGMVFKGLDGVIEVISGIAVLAFGRDRLNHFAATLPWHVHPFSGGSVHFAAFYLLFQGVVKLWLAEALLRERLKVFPVALVLMVLLECYMIFRMATHPGIGLVVLFVLNLIIILLIWREYRQLRERDEKRPVRAAA